MEYFVVECYCTCILREFKIFFQPAKFDNFKDEKFQTLKLSQFQKAKTCWAENWWSSGIMSNFWGEFFYILGGKKIFKIFLKNILATALKSYMKWLLKFFFFFFEKIWKSWKNRFFGLILRFSNLNVLHKGLLLQDWVFRLGHTTSSRKE